MQSYDFYFIYMCVCVLKFDIQCAFSGGAAVSAAPTKQVVLSILLVHFCSVGALETSAPPIQHPL